MSGFFKSGIEVRVPNLPRCDFCHQESKDVDAHYDGKTSFGPWAYMCGEHYRRHGVGLGTGLGQRLVASQEEG